VTARTAALVALALIGAAASARAGDAVDALRCSRLAFPLVEGETAPELVLAQRAIEREWGLSEDSVYVEIDVPRWRSEVVAAMMSAAVPGAGQTWVGGPKRGLWFALAEAAAWTARILLHRSGEAAREDAAAFAGAPQDSTSAWSAARWQAANGGEAADALALYSADPEAFFDAIATDPRYLAGWTGDPQASRHEFASLRATSDRRLRGARFSEQMLWVNHVVATVDAIRAARLHNRTLLPGAVGISVRGSWHRGPGFTAVLERRF
jgi:hypothetical protein